MEPGVACLRPDRRRVVAAGVCALAGAAVFQFCGNGTRGYIGTASLFEWWGRQWLDPAGESGHGPMIVLLAAWIFWRNLGNAERGVRSAEARPQPALPSVAGGWSATSLARSAGEAPAGAAGSHPEAPAGSDIPHAAFRAPHGVAAATAAMLGALALHALGYAAQQARVSIVALLLFAWGALALAGGRRWGRAAAFPLAFMLFAVPANFLDSVGFPLRLAVTRAAAELADLAGAGVIRSGTQLFSPDGAFQYDVAAACSGVRSLTALAALSLLVGWLEFRGAGRRLAVAALCVPLAFAGNVARVTAAVLAGERFGQRGGERVHDAAGLAVFVAVLGGVVLAARWWARRWPEKTGEGRREEGEGRREEGEGRQEAGRADTEAPTQNPKSKTQNHLTVAVLVLLAAVATAGWTARVDAWPVARTAGVRLAADGVNPVELPSLLNTGGGLWLGARAEVTQVERDTLPADTGFARKTYRSVRAPGREVFLSVVLSGRDRTSIHRPELCLVGQGWSITGDFAHEFVLKPAGGSEAPAAGGRKIPATVLRVTQEVVGPGGVRRRVPALFAYWFVGGDTVAATSRERLWRTATDRLLHFRADRWAYVVAQTVADDGEAAALARLETVVAAAAPEFQLVTMEK